MVGMQLGVVAAYHVSGTPQVVRRTPGVVRRVPIDLLRIWLQRSGCATVRQDGREVVLQPSQMAIYEAGRPYQLRLEHRWSGAVLAFPRDGLGLPENLVADSMTRAHTLTDGPGAVLASFVSSVIEQRRSIDGRSAGRLGEASLHLVAGTLSAAAPQRDGSAEALRLQILSYVRAHLTETDLTHARVAAAHHMAARTLHRLFEEEPCTVTGYIRSCRLEGVRRDLADPLLAHRSVAAVAARWCFTSPAHFTRAFHARYGVNPSAVRAPDQEQLTGGGTPGPDGA
jgi:AraC-like DNA-binding protein